MKPEDFNSLDNNDQVQVVLEGGVYMSSYKEENFVYDVYQLDDMFIKLVYDIHKKDEPRVVQFNDVDLA